MKNNIRCFYCNQLETGILNSDKIPPRENNHIFKILRGKENSEILLIDGKGSIAEAVIESKQSIRISKVTKLPSPETKVHLFVAPPRKNQMDQLLRQCAEVGVWSITPIITERSVAKPVKDSSHDRMEVLLMEGCKQAHNPFFPVLNTIKKLSEIQKEIQSFDHTFFGSTKSCGTNILNKNNTALQNMRLSGGIAWIVGPEGGFSNTEEQFLVDGNAQPLQLGSWFMRVETAAIVGASFLLNNHTIKHDV